MYTALAIVQGDRSSRDAIVVRLWFSMPSLASGRRRRCALAVHIGRLYRSSSRAGRSVKSRRARCALMVLDAFLGASDRRRRCVLAVHIGRLYCSRHRTGRLFKSRRALCVHGARSPSLAPGRRHCCALAVHIGRSYRSRHRARQSSSRDALVVR